MTIRAKPTIVLSVTKKPNGRLILNYTNPSKIAISSHEAQQDETKNVRP
jgi:hypothetical protein